MMATITESLKINKGLFLITLRAGGKIKYVLFRTYPVAIIPISQTIAEDLRDASKRESTIESLELMTGNKLLVTNDKYIENNYVTALLIMASTCNLGCTYCLVGQGEYGNYKGKIITQDVIDATISYISNSIKKSYNKLNVDSIDFGIDFFGGEPLLAERQVRYTVDKVKSKSIELTKELGIEVKPSHAIATNLTLVTDKIAKFMSENNMSIIASVDGPWHDNYRKYKRGFGSYALAIRGLNILTKYAENNPDLLIRVNTVLTPEVVSHLDEYVEWVKNTIPKLDNLHITLNLVRGNVGVTNMEREQPNNVYSFEDAENIAVAISKLSSNGYKTYESYVKNNLLQGGSLFKCMAGIERIAVMPNGDVYPCQGFADTKLKFGNIKDEGFSHSKPQFLNFFFQRNLLEIGPCNDCVLQSVCSFRFDCPSHSYEDKGNLCSIDPIGCYIGKKVQTPIFGDLINKIIS